MSEKKEICMNCGDRYCCRGLCREMNELLIQERKQNQKEKRLQNEEKYENDKDNHKYQS